MMRLTLLLFFIYFDDLRHTTCVYRLFARLSSVLATRQFASTPVRRHCIYEQLLSHPVFPLFLGSVHAIFTRWAVLGRTHCLLNVKKFVVVTSYLVVLIKIASSQYIRFLLLEPDAEDDMASPPRIFSRAVLLPLLIQGWPCRCSPSCFISLASTTELPPQQFGGEVFCSSCRLVVHLGRFSAHSDGGFGVYPFWSQVFSGR